MVELHYYTSTNVSISWVVVGLQRGPPILVSRNELFAKKVAAPVYRIENTVVGISHADHVAPSILKCWH
jgi:hypothetical protein